MSGILYIVATPIGNLNDISNRELSILEEVNLIAAEDTRITKKLLNKYQINNKLISYNNFNENSIYVKIVDLLLDGKNIAFATTRIEGLKDCVGWLNELPSDFDQIWFAIGPEGGWDEEEESLAFDLGLEPVHMGETILRTSTAAVAACQLMSSWRRTRSLFGE